MVGKKISDKNPTSLKRVICRETLNAVLINAGLGGLITWLVLPGADSMSLIGGPESAGFGLFPPSVLFPLLFTLIMSSVIRGKIRDGKICGCSGTGARIIGKMPENTAARALVITAFFSIIFAPLVLLVVAALTGQIWSKAEALVLNVAYLVVMTAIVAPVVILAAAHHSGNSR